MSTSSIGPATDRSRSEQGAGQAEVDRDQGPELQLLAERQRQHRERREAESEARRWLWLSHHWPEHYEPRCIRVGPRHVCRRCAALYPLGFLVAFSSALGYSPWPGSWDPAMIWLLCLPATVAFVGEALGWFRYTVRWQVGTTLIAAVAFGRALGYELVDRWSPEFWGPIAVFGGLWFWASQAAASARSQ